MSGDASKKSRRYTWHETESMREQGYEFTEFTLLMDSEPMYIITGRGDARRTQAEEDTA